MDQRDLLPVEFFKALIVVFNFKVRLDFQDKNVRTFHEKRFLLTRISCVRFEIHADPVKASVISAGNDEQNCNFVI